MTKPHCRLENLPSGLLGSERTNCTSFSGDGECTPVTVQQHSVSWMPPTVPETPAKQRRTVHGPLNERRLTHISGSHRHVRSSVKDIRGSASGRRRSSVGLSQFGALQLDDSTNSMPLIAHDTGAVEPPQQQQHCFEVSHQMAPPPFHSVAALFPSQSLSPYVDCVPRCGQSMSFVHPSPDLLDCSQAETDYSNFFNRRILTDYREVKELGCGSFGRVTLYEEASTGSLVAVKASPPLMNIEQRQRFVREKVILNLIRGFPHVVQLLDAWEEGRSPQIYLQLEYCRGGSVADLAELRRRQGERWDERELFIFIGHMALALDALHSANIAHVDFKPDNVLIDEGGGYKLSDFGCSVVLNEDGQPLKHFAPNVQRSSAVGTGLVNSNNGVMETNLLSMPTQLSINSVEEGDCRYLCSDMLNQKRHLKAGDMFSFGISLFELMSGQLLPHHGASFLELRQGLPVELLECRGYSRSLVDLVSLLMHKDPTARPTARDVMRFFQLPSQVPQLVAHWTGSSDTNNGDGEERVSLLEMRFVHAALEVSSRLVDLKRRSLVGDSAGGKVVDVRRTVTHLARVDIDESCTPKTPVAHALDGN